MKIEEMRDPVRKSPSQNKEVPKMTCRIDGTVPKSRHEAGTFMETDEEPG